MHDENNTIYNNTKVSNIKKNIFIDYQDQTTYNKTSKYLTRNYIHEDNNTIVNKRVVKKQLPP